MNSHTSDNTSVPGPGVGDTRQALSSAAGDAMGMRSARIGAGSTGGPWFRHGKSGLCIFPYRHYSMEFAALPAMEDLRQFDKICYEFPASLPQGILRRAIADVAPGVGAVLISSREPAFMRVPEYPGDPHLARRKVFLSSLLPITTDAMIMAMRKVMADPENGPSSEFVDVDVPAEGFAADEERPSFPFVDPQEMAEKGLAGWYSGWLPVLRSTPHAQRDAYREIHMALHVIESVLKPDLRGLLFCGAAHFHEIVPLLDRNPDDLREELARLARPKPLADLEPQFRQGWFSSILPGGGSPPHSKHYTVCRLDPSLMYSLHMMDIPYVVSEFEREFAAGTLRVDRPSWIRKMIASCWQRTGRPVSPRQLAVMETFMARRMISGGRWSCDLDKHLLPSAMAAAGKSFAHELEQEAMKYAHLPSGTPPEGRMVPFSEQAFLLFVDKEVHLVAFPASKTSHGGNGRPIRTRQPDTLTDKEKRDVTHSGLRMKPPPEELLHEHMCNTARSCGHDCLPVITKYRILPYRGNLGRGLDARRSIRALASGDNTLYVRRSLRTPKRQIDCDECAIVWIFHRSLPIVYRETDFFSDNSRGETLLTSFFWFHQRLYVEPIRFNRIAWFVRLYRNVTPSWDKELVERKLIARLPADKFCNLRPWHDSDLPFDSNDPDLAVACAAKWGICDHVIIVRVDQSYQIGERARTFARDRGVRLLEPDVAGFDRILLDRYEKDHEVPTEGTWCPPDPVAARMIEPVPGFDRHRPHYERSAESMNTLFNVTSRRKPGEELLH